ncbi:MAG: hypothetical protein J0M12_14925 [Deltaproteobacteria bacterium]|nr:hypothetical protein [Deltaproteobacteria bacterium]
MFLLKILAFVPLFFAFPNPNVNWSGGEHNAVRISADGRDEIINQCIRSGLEVRYRYEMRICRHRILWADYCGDERVVIRSLNFDPISESYRVVIDRLGDKEPAKVTTATSLEKALGTVTTLTSPPLSSLGFNSSDFPQNRSPFLGVRVIADCKGDYNETIAKISNFLTLGLVDVGSFDSGWVAFSLAP